jgi:cobalamin biosynthesis Co2+ chelatase CbiK
MKRLWLSFTGLCWQITSGKLALSDIEYDLFFFGCGSQHIFEGELTGKTPTETRTYGYAFSEFFGYAADLKKTVEESISIAKQIRDLLSNSREAGRLVCRLDTERDNYTAEHVYEKLEEFLKKNGYDVKMPFMRDPDSSYPGIKDVLEKLNVQLEVRT